jgi:hypothetical protein
MLPFGVATPATVPQRSEIPEELMNYPVYTKMSDLTSVFPIISICVIVYLQTTFHIQDIDISTPVIVTTSVNNQCTLYIIN